MFQEFPQRVSILSATKFCSGFSGRDTPGFNRSCNQFSVLPCGSLPNSSRFGSLGCLRKAARFGKDYLNKLLGAEKNCKTL